MMAIVYFVGVHGTRNMDATKQKVSLNIFLRSDMKVKKKGNNNNRDQPPNPFQTKCID